MGLDRIHDIQAIYREVLDAMARPGSIHSIEAQASKEEVISGCYVGTLALAKTLIDTEVTYYLPVAHAELNQLFYQHTHAKQAELREADFLFILRQGNDGELRESLLNAKRGTLTDPHQSATIIVEVDQLFSKGDLLLSGPGIETEVEIAIHGSEEWLEVRAEVNSEYPLGIDLIFIDANQQIVCIPRTTQMKRRVVE
ncbi:phosphonate C-P lyase system protein PhnH [Bacillaceae bacterium SAOS 7]|nr:phosphonate C-P lyase system protein PhnH [Bacillaceae bacterium SAOS 7]